MIPAIVHFLKCMTLHVRVPVLSEKRYLTCKNVQTERDKTVVDCVQGKVS